MFLDLKSSLDTNYFSNTMYFGLKIVLDQKICMSPKFVWTQDLYGPKMFLDPKFLDPLTFGTQFNLRKEIDCGFGPTSF